MGVSIYLVFKFLRTFLYEKKKRFSALYNKNNAFFVILIKLNFNSFFSLICKTYYLKTPWMSLESILFFNNGRKIQRVSNESHKLRD